jgi:hypothetical protein
VRWRADGTNAWAYRARDPGTVSSAKSPGVTGTTSSQGASMSHQPPKENKKKPLLTAKEKKVAKQQKKHVNDAPRFIKS